MATVTLRYYFGQEDEGPFEYEVEVNYANYLKPYLEEKYADVKDAVGNFVFSDDEKKEALQCKNLDELADYIIGIDEEWAESIVESDEDFVKNYVKEDLKEKNKEEAYEDYEDSNSGGDPDGFSGWDDYWHWKNG